MDEVNPLPQSGEHEVVVTNDTTQRTLRYFEGAWFRVFMWAIETGTFFDCSSGAKAAYILINSDAFAPPLNGEPKRDPIDEGVCRLGRDEMIAALKSNAGNVGRAVKELMLRGMIVQVGAGRNGAKARFRVVMSSSEGRQLLTLNSPALAKFLSKNSAYKRRWREKLGARPERPSGARPERPSGARPERPSGARPARAYVKRVPIKSLDTNSDKDLDIKTKSSPPPASLLPPGNPPVSNRMEGGRGSAAEQRLQRALAVGRGEL